MATTRDLLRQLTIPHHAQDAYRRLLALGFSGVPVALAGLHHDNAAVRRHCCAFLDHFLVPEALPDLIAMLHDPDPIVRQTTLHTLACDRCKEGACRPEEAAVLPEAIRLLHDDDDAHVRAMALEVIGQYVHSNPVAMQVLVAAQTDDASPAVRKKAGWYAPGGPIYRRTAPRLPRKAKTGSRHDALTPSQRYHDAESSDAVSTTASELMSTPDELDSTCVIAVPNS